MNTYIYATLENVNSSKLIRWFLMFQTFNYITASRNKCKIRYTTPKKKERSMKSMVLLLWYALFYFLLHLLGDRSWNKNTHSWCQLYRLTERCENPFGMRKDWKLISVVYLYLFCIGLEPLLGILRKLSFSPLRDSSFISLFICKSLTAWLEVKSLEAGAIWRPSTLFLLLNKTRSSRIRAAEIDADVWNLFIVNFLFDLFFILVL